MNGSAPEASHSEVAFYYPGWMWHSDNAIKNLLLFFDGIAVLVPEYLKHSLERRVPEIVLPLMDAKLLHILEAETMIDRSATEDLAEAMTEIIVSGLLDPLASQETRFHELSYSRLGGRGDQELAKMIHEELKARGLARDTEDGVSIPLHPLVHSLVLVLHSQILIPYGRKTGLALEPTTDRPQLVAALGEVLSLPSMPSAGSVVATDLATIGVDLSAIPLDEVLSFRTEHGNEYRSYRRAVKAFVRDLSSLSPPERVAALGDRTEEIDDLARDIERLSTSSWKRPATFSLGVAGAVYSAVSGDPVSAALSLGAILIGKERPKAALPGSYSYLFSAGHRYA